MNDAEFIGSLIVALVTISGLFTVIVKIVISPVNELSISIVKLESTLLRIDDQNKNIEDRINKLKIRVHDLEKTTARTIK